LNDEVESALMFKARNCRCGEFVTSGGDVVNYYKLLYSFYVFSSDYHSGMRFFNLSLAALIMYQFAKRLESHVVEYNVDLLEVVSHRASALLASINSLGVVTEEDARVTVPGDGQKKILAEFGMDDLEMGM
jgi:hypothetical protein